MNGFAIAPVWYSRCLCKLIFLRNALSHWLHLYSCSCVWVLWWSCMVRLRLKLSEKKEMNFKYIWSVSESELKGKSQNGSYPKPQTGHLCGRWSECTVICVKSPPRWVKLMPHNSHVNFRTAGNKTNTFNKCRQFVWCRRISYVLLAAAVVSLFSLALAHCDALLYDYLFVYFVENVCRIYDIRLLDTENEFACERAIASVVWTYTWRDGRNKLHEMLLKNTKIRLRSVTQPTFKRSCIRMNRTVCGECAFQSKPSATILACILKILWIWCRRFRQCVDRQFLFVV